MFRRKAGKSKSSNKHNRLHRDSLKWEEGSLLERKENEQTMAKGHYSQGLQLLCTRGGMAGEKKNKKPTLAMASYYTQWC